MPTRPMLRGRPSQAVLAAQRKCCRLQPRPSLSHPALARPADGPLAGSKPYEAGDGRAAWCGPWWVPSKLHEWAADE